MTAASRSSNLEGQFDKAIPAEYWHYMAKNCLKPKPYDNKAEVAQKIAGIAKRLGKCSFDTAAGPNQWTPVHVAVLTGNVPCLEFLLSHGARIDGKDTNGQTAIDLAKEHHPELLPRLVPYHQISASRRELFAQMLEPLFPAKPASSDFRYDPHTDDFGVTNKKLLFCRDVDPSTVGPETVEEAAEKKGISALDVNIGLRSNHLNIDIARVGNFEGFDVETTRHLYYPRDHYTRTIRGRVVVTSSEQPEAIASALDRGTSHSCYFSSNAAFNSTHQLLAAAAIGMSSKVKDALKDCQLQRNSAPPSELRFFIECGDKFVMTNQRGEKVLAIGAQHLPMIHSYCLLSKLFDDPCITVIPPKDVSDEVILSTAEEMYALGFLKIDGQSGFLNYEKLIKLISTKGKYAPTEYRKKAIDLGLIKAFRMTGEQLQEARPVVEEYLGQREVVKTRLARFFDVEEKNVIAVPNCGYHLDTVMAPGPHGQMFLYDPEITLEVIEKLIAKKKALKLTDKDLTLLNQYSRTALQMKRELGPLFKGAERALGRAGIPVIKTPGIFFDVPMRASYPLTSNVHFMNPVTGWSEKNRAYYYITTGTSVGDNLGPALMDLYAQFLEMQIPGVHVHYIGRNPKNPQDFTQAMQLYNVVGKNPPQAGIHCHSFPLETAEAKST